MRTKILAIITEFWQKLRESEKLPLVITLGFLGLMLFTLLSASFIDYLLYTPQEQLRPYLEGWQQFFETIFFYLLAGISILLILWLTVTLILLCLELLGITLASIGGLVKEFVTEFLYWIDRLKKFLKPMADALIKDYSYLQKDLDSLKLKIWEEIISCCILRKKLLNLDEQAYFETLNFLDDQFVDIGEDYSSHLEKTRDFDIMLYLNKTWKAQRLVRRMKKTRRDLRVLRRQLEERGNYLNLHG